MKEKEIKRLRKILDPFAKQILYWCAKYDFSFPRSCDIVSKYILAKIKENNLFHEEYEISVVRGHYIVDEEDSCVDFAYGLKHNPCENCTCEGVYQHTFLLFRNKRTNECSIIDYSHYQFNENYGDLEEILLNKQLFKEEMFEEISKYSTFVDIKEQEKYMFSRVTSINDFEVYGVLEEYFTEATAI